jgi:hypothetical protein
MKGGAAVESLAIDFGEIWVVRFSTFATILAQRRHSASADVGYVPN